MFSRKSLFHIPGKRAAGIYTALLFLCCMLCMAPVFAQKKVAEQKELVYLNATNLITIKTDSGNLTKFIGDAIFIQGTDTLHCDSLYDHDRKPLPNMYEAFSNVRIAQTGGTQGTSDYLRYTADNKEAFMQGNVNLTDGKNRLACAELTYNLGTKTGVYNNGGTLYSDSTVVSSNTGVYNVKDKNARFKGNVHITDPTYKIISDDLGYNTETKFETFYAHSIVISDSGKSILETSNGTYDSKKGAAHFVSHPKIWDDGQYIEADTLNYDKSTGFGLGLGHVISIDTAHHSKLFCGRLEYYQKRRVLWATIRPVLEQVNGKDTLYMRADTFYSAPMVKAKQVIRKKDMVQKADTAARSLDSTAAFKNVKGVNEKAVDTLSLYVHDKTGKKTDTIRSAYKPGYKIPAMEDTIHVATTKKGKRKKGTDMMLAVTDTTTADTTAPLYFIGYHHVKIFSDSLQGKCDSVCYTRSDSTIRMMYTPIVWAHNSQITGDTILLHLDSSELRSLYVPNNAFTISQSGPPKAQLFDQVQGKTLTAYFNKNQITRVVVFPNAECIYFPIDEKGAYLGLNQSKSARMRIFFEDQKIVNIKFEQEANIVLTPLEKADIPGARLSRFKWLIEQRPKTKEELFN